MCSASLCTFSEESVFLLGILKSLQAFQNPFFHERVQHRRVPLRPSRENRIPERPQTLRYSEIINSFSLNYAQSKAERISNRPALRLKALPEWHRPWRCSQGRCSHRSCCRLCAAPCPVHGSQRSQWHRLPLPCQRSTAASWRQTGCRRLG